ncbi:MAG: hypothetical protein RLZZ01_2373 [Actinomycetota bacterium]
MAHVDPRREHRRAKMLDLARASVSGNRHDGYTSKVRTARHLRRRREDRLLAGLFDVRCTLDLDCGCAICVVVSERGEPRPIRLKDLPDGWELGLWQVDNLAAGRRMAASKVLEFDGEFDPWFSWLKRHLPDTVAGRHLLDHIIVSTWCCADAKQNHRGCSCRETNRGGWWTDLAGRRWDDIDDDAQV